MLQIANGMGPLGTVSLILLLSKNNKTGALYISKSVTYVFEVQ